MPNMFEDAAAHDHYMAYDQDEGDDFIVHTHECPECGAMWRCDSALCDQRLETCDDCMELEP